jgi:NADH:ubiquinone oxidoreductase subunit 2 (subunit N)
MLIIAILILLLAATSTMERNFNYLADYVKFNRIVLIIFILGSYLAYNTLDVEALSDGVGIYGGVFKVTVLSQVFDIILFLTGAIVTVLTCFAPYNYKRYDNSLSIKYIMRDNNLSSTEEGIFVEKDLLRSQLQNNYLFFKSKLTDYYNKNMLKYSSDNNIKINYGNLKKLGDILINKFNYITPFLVEKKLTYPKLEVKEYSFLLLYTVLGGSLLISSQNLISLYLSLELQSFTLYILSTSQIRSFKGTSGGLKYFLLGGLSSGFILLGCSLLYAYTGTLNLEHVFMIYSDSLTNYFIDPCLLILFAGLLFKVSAAPFHNWAPDVYSDVPTYSTTWLIIIAKLSILILMLILIHNIHSGLNLNNFSLIEEYYNLNDYYMNDDNFKDNELPGWVAFDEIPDMYWWYMNEHIPFSYWNPSYSSLGLWTNVLTISALFSLVIGTVLGLSQSRIKRLFAYSTITHVGFLLLALSLNSVASIDAFIFYLIQYTITNLNLFFILVAWGYLYCRYYLEKDFLSLRLLKINPLSSDTVYIEPTLYDFLESVKDERDEWNRVLDPFHPDKSIRVNTIYNLYLITPVNEDLNYYDFNTEDSEWLYTPVPFLTNFKGMHGTDPFLAFCLAVTIFSLAGIPPLIGFFAKQQILLASMQIDYYFISIVAILTSVIGAAYYLRIIKFIYFYDDVFMPYYMKNKEVNINNQVLNFSREPDFIIDSMNKDSELPMLPSNSLSLIIAVLTNISLFYILKPYILINAIYTITIPLFPL